MTALQKYYLISPMLWNDVMMSVRVCVCVCVCVRARARDWPKKYSLAAAGNRRPS